MGIWIEMFSISWAYGDGLKDIFITYVKYRDLNLVKGEFQGKHSSCKI